jgi:hypothetical protein
MLQDLGDRERRAREAVRKVLKNIPWLFDREESRRFYRVHMERESIEKLVELAREGDKDAAEILQNRGRVARSTRVDLPMCFHEFVWEWFLNGPPKAKSGLSPKDLGLRNSIIDRLVKIVSRDYGFPEYPNPEYRGDSDAPMTACRIVGEELGFSERTIEEWLRPDPTTG